MLHQDWKELEEVIDNLPDKENYIDAPGVIPTSEHMFRALDVLPARAQVVIFGQDPYPRAESAVGQAFNDGKVRQWTDPMSPSLRNIIKSVLLHEELLRDPKAPVAEVRAALSRASFAPPPAWFKATAQRGVMWINTALTFSGKTPAELRRHQEFWRPVIEKVVDMVTHARAEAGVAFVLFGGHAQKLESIIKAASKAVEGEAAVRVVKLPHPAREGFHAGDVTPFSAVHAAQKELGLTPIDFVVKSKRKAWPTAGEKKASE